MVWHRGERSNISQIVVYRSILRLPGDFPLYAIPFLSYIEMSVWWGKYITCAYIHVHINIESN